MLKQFVLSAMIAAGMVTGANPVVTVTEPEIRVREFTVASEVTESPEPGLRLVGEGQVLSGNFITLKVEGVESKIVDGVRLPGVRVGIDPPTQNLIREDNGYRLYLTEPLPKGVTEKEFLITVAVNNPDPVGLPFVVMRRVKIIGDLADPSTPPDTNPVDPPAVPNKITSVAYVYEKNLTKVKPDIKAALSDLNSKGITATLLEQDSTNGTGAIPKQFVAPLEAAKKVGLPALVLYTDGVVVGAVPNPGVPEIEKVGK